MTETQQVPVEPTAAMKQAGRLEGEAGLGDRLLKHAGIPANIVRNIYKAMLAAAPTTEPSEVERLAVEIATEAAIESVACECSLNHMDDGSVWADTGYARKHDVNLERELRYLDLRGLLEHHPDHPEWVRVKDQKS